MASNATIRSRVDSLTLDVLVGMTVGAARDKFATILGISANAYPTLNGAAVGGEHVIRVGETINFAVALGEKGI
jgi:hypothetical protein